ncbi:starvation protein A [Acinetobacter qingfengensis]|uniref:Starvation protein A n=1 Tax=Acinetobacter qingfengensis TaxID=1262585 RepID=A0A1E7RFR4_9GAMM|nr:glutathione S-transferase N-terminal domain-containing protein [Acinetobacter qingfengensis]KAA8732749.1 starvation protein A [Acinetobacter qingfengensis]OEY98136.1 starvation protein A [Acinetobacter qingfengensis]
MSVIDTSPYHGITLYCHPNDHYSHSVRFVLSEKKIQYRQILIEDAEEDLSQLNPYATLPTLVDPQVKLFNTAIINEYIDDRYRQSRLYADAPAEKAQQRQFIWRIEQDWFRLANILLRHPDTLDAQQQQHAKKELQDILISLNPLFQHYPYFMSENLSILDCTLAPMLLRILTLTSGINMKNSKGLILYCKRVFNRDSFQQSLTVMEQTRYTEILKTLK